jgi:hypothetical protein
MMKDGEQQKDENVNKITSGNTKGVENKHWKHLGH